MASTSGSRSTTGSPTAATCPGSGTRTSSYSTARCAAWCAPAPERRRWPCASSTRVGRRTRSRSWTASRSRSTARSPVPTDGCSPSHLHGAARAAQAARRPQHRPGVLAVSARLCKGVGRKLMLGRARTPDEVAWHEVECGTYSADLPLWEELAEEHGGPILELGCGTGRVALHSPARVMMCSASTPSVAGRHAQRTRPRGGAAGARDRRRRGELRPRRALPARHRADAARPAARSAAPSDARPRCRALQPGGMLAASLVEADSLPEPDHRARPRRGASLPDVRELDGWIYSSLPLNVRRANGAISIERLRQVVAPGALTEEVDITELDPLRPASSRTRPATPGSKRGLAGTCRPPTGTSARPCACWRLRDGAAVAGPVSGPDEHLRRPREHDLPRAGAANGAGSGSPTPPRDPASASTPARTT